MAERTEVLRALAEVIDPELGINVVELGMVGDIELADDSVVVNLRLTTMSCPFWDLFVDQVKAAVGAVGFRDVDVRFDGRASWSPAMMSATARRELEAVGLLPLALARRRENRATEQEVIHIVRGGLTVPRHEPPVSSTGGAGGPRRHPDRDLMVE